MPSTALAQGAKPQTKSLDSEAPPGSPPHWLPNETWVMQHWLPYDETRLYSLLGVTRGDIWRWLRDDTRNLAGLAALHGWEAHALARELVAPWQGKLREPGRMALLESRALRTLTQGHLSQHMFFHSLHQDAIPDAAPEIFGTSHDALPLPAPLRALAADDLPAQRQVARARPGGGGADAARRWSRAACAGRRSRRRRRSGCSPASCARSRAGCSRRATTARRR